LLHLSFRRSTTPDPLAKVEINPAIPEFFASPR
jgi:hypothetical protein